MAASAQCPWALPKRNNLLTHVKVNVKLFASLGVLYFMVLELQLIVLHNSRLVKSFFSPFQLERR